MITILQGKGDEDFTIFCRMLRQCNYEVWAHELELTAESNKASKGISSCLSVVYELLHTSSFLLYNL